MKTLTLVMLSVMITLSSYGQQRRQQRFPDIGFFYLPQKTSISNSISDKSDPIYKNKPTFAGGAGISFTWYKNKRGGIQTGLMYIAHNQKFKSEVKVKDGESKIWEGKKSLDYLKVPLLLQLHSSTSRKSPIDFIVFGGPQFAYLIKSSGAVVLFQHYGEGLSDYYDLHPAEDDTYKKFVLELAAGVGFNFRLSKTISLTTALRADYSITDVENKDAVSYEELGLDRSTYYIGDKDRRAGRNNSIGIMVGLNYAIGGQHHLLAPTQKWF